MLWLNAADDEIKLKLPGAGNKKSFLCIFNKLNIAQNGGDRAEKVAVQQHNVA